MNERIRELVRESHLDVYGLGKERYKWEYTVEKFAELIVQECADVAKETRWAVPPSQEQIARGIQQHFGVEE
jgi:hypothetical protein